MNIEVHTINGIKVAEVLSDQMVIRDAEDGMELLGNLYYQDFDKIIVHARNITPDFFDLKTGIAGEVLQKFSNYRVRLAIVGDFSGYESGSLNDFMFESNRHGQVSFVASTAVALDKFLKRG